MSTFNSEKENNTTSDVTFINTIIVSDEATVDYPPTSDYYGTPIISSTTATEDRTDENEITASDLETDAFNEYLSNSEIVESRVGSAIPRYTFVHGLPFQFSSITDRRMNDGSDAYGRVFAREIVANTPVAVITPCIPLFMGNNVNSSVKTEDKNAIKELIADAGDNAASIFNGISENFSSENAINFFELEPSTVAYYENVSGLCAMSAISMGIGDMEYPLDGNGRTKKLKDLDWGDYNGDIDTYALIGDITGPQLNSVSIAFDPSGGITDSVSNSTRESSIAGLLKGKTAEVQELEFLMGFGAGSSLDGVEDMTASITDVISSMGGNSNNPNSIFNTLPNIAKTVVSGSNIRFPEIWGDSSKGSDGFSISVKLQAPYATPFAKWRWVVVPFWHLWCLAAPDAFNPTSYATPYLIKGFSKGYFNIEQGIVSSMSYRKYGDGNMMSYDGIPTQIDIDLSFKELFTALGKTNISDPAAFFANTGLMELLGSLTGTNMSRLSIDDNIANRLYAEGERYIGAPGRAFERITQGIQNTILSLTN